MVRPFHATNDGHVVPAQKPDRFARGALGRRLRRRWCASSTITDLDRNSLSLGDWYRSCFAPRADFDMQGRPT